MASYLMRRALRLNGLLSRGFITRHYSSKSGSDSNNDQDTSSNNKSGATPSNNEKSGVADNNSAVSDSDNKKSAARGDKDKKEAKELKPSDAIQETDDEPKVPQTEEEKMAELRTWGFSYDPNLPEHASRKIRQHWAWQKALYKNTDVEVCSSSAISLRCIVVVLKSYVPDSQDVRSLQATSKTKTFRFA